MINFLSSCPGDCKSQTENNNIHKIPANICEKVEVEKQSEASLSKDTSQSQQPIVSEEASDVGLIEEPSLSVPTKHASAKDAGLDNNEENVGGEYDNGGKKRHSGERGRSQTQGKWRGVDPVVFFKDETTINSIQSFYGISESFPLYGHLVTRNEDATHVKRIYYISKSVHNALQLNIQAGQRLKITSLGLKVFVSIQFLHETILYY